MERQRSKMQELNPDIVLVFTRYKIFKALDLKSRERKWVTYRVRFRDVVVVTDPYNQEVTIKRNIVL
jgi:hypothetical protein